MAKSRVSINPLYRGGAGGYSFYVRDGEQVVRQRKNNSNYGETASRSYAQMIRRIKWGNLVNVYRLMKSWQPKAYEQKKIGQTDYNIFMALNINKVTCGTTKEMNESGCAIIEPFQISRGSLTPIDYQLVSGSTQYLTDIALTITISGTTTVGQLSADIIANNPLFQANDNLAFVFFNNWREPRVEWPNARTIYSEITLNPSSATLLSSVPVVGSRINKSTGGFLQVYYSAGVITSVNNEVGVAIIHTRKVAQELQVSTQSILMNQQTLINEFSGDAWYDTCIQTYGLDTEVPLDPSFRRASISSVTANGSAVSSGDVLSGSQEIVISGENLSKDNVKLVFNGIEYTPLSMAGGSLHYILGDNGRARILSNGLLYMELTVEDVVVPEELPTGISVFTYSKWKTAYDPGAIGQRIYEDNINCLNAPFQCDSTYKYLRCSIAIAGMEESDFTFDNVTAHLFSTEDSSTLLCLEPTDITLPVVVKYQDFIVIVSNYAN